MREQQPACECTPAARRLLRLLHDPIAAGVHLRRPRDAKKRPRPHDRATGPVHRAPPAAMWATSTWASSTASLRAPRRRSFHLAAHGPGLWLVELGACTECLGVRCRRSSSSCCSRLHRCRHLQRLRRRWMQRLESLCCVSALSTCSTFRGSKLLALSEVMR